MRFPLRLERQKLRATDASIYYHTTTESERNFLTHVHYFTDSSTCVRVCVCVLSLANGAHMCLPFLFQFNLDLVYCTPNQISHVPYLIAPYCRKLKDERKIC